VRSSKALEPQLRLGFFYVHGWTVYRKEPGGGACMSSCKEIVGRLLLVEKPKTKFPEFSPSFKGFDQRQKTNDQRPFLVKEY